MCGVGKNAPGQREGVRVELEDGDIGEAIVVRIKELVVVVARAYQAPARRRSIADLDVKKSARLALDDAQQGLLAAVRARQIAFVKQEQTDGENPAMTSTGTMTR